MNRKAVFQALCKVYPSTVEVAMILSSYPTEELPGRRRGYTDKYRLGGQTVYLRTGEYADGRLGEIFLDASRQGALLRALLNCFAMAVSAGLQRGVPLQQFVEMYKDMKFEPRGHVEGHPQIKEAESITDLIFRSLELQYLPLPPEGGEERHVSPDDEGGGGVPPEARGARGGREVGAAGASEKLADAGGAG